MSLFTDLRDVLTPYAQRIKSLAADLDDLDTLTAPPRLDDNTDLNSVIESGVYTLYATSSYLNKPTQDGEHGILEVWEENYENTGRIFQRLTYTYKAGRTNSEIWVRTYSPLTSAWTPWVISGGSGLTDNVKVALLACFRHALWVDEHGQDYYDALSNALFPDGEPDERIVYEIPHNTDISALSIDTNKHAYTMDENFTFLAKATWNPAEAGAFLLDSQSTTGSVVGARVQAALVDNNTNVIYKNQFNGGTGNNGSGGQTSNSFSASTQHTVTYIMRNNNKSITHKIYVDGILEYEDSRTLTAKTNTWPSTYYIGMNHGNQMRPWDGIIDLYRIYNEALSDSEINSILGLST